MEKERHSIDLYICMYEAHSMEYIQIYESIVIEFLRQLKTVIHCERACESL